MPRRPSTLDFWNADFQSEHFRSSWAAPAGAAVGLSPDAESPPYCGIGDPLSDGSLGVQPMRVSEDPTGEAREPSAYLMRKPRSLRQACHDSERDDDGRQCPACDLRDLCERQANATAAAE